jgi:DNA (cytosine-5)-methyltransferase 1
LNYYNEIDPGAAAWLRELIKERLIPDGEVDERSIEDILPAELAGYTQCHFFAGIGGWSYALALAGWPEDRPVWTGSCPCQSFSAAGKGKGFADERHLWPAWFHLICQCRPVAVFGEQVAASIGHGWLDLVSLDMEGEGYAFGAAVLPACGVGAPHIRQRLLWMADANSDRAVGYPGEEAGARKPCRAESGGRGTICRMADGLREPSQRGAGSVSGAEAQVGSSRLAHGNRADGYSDGRQARHPNPTNGFWGDVDWLFCRDGKWRPIEPGTFPLADGVPARVVRLRGYGNSIVPQAAAEVISAYMGGGAW